MKIILDNSIYFRMIKPVHYIIAQDEESKKWLLYERYGINGKKDSFYAIRTYEFETEDELNQFGLMLMLEQ